MNHPADFEQMTCPVPRTDHQRILLGHGSGGKMSADLISQVFLPLLGNDVLSKLEDSALLDLFDAKQRAENGQLPRVAFTTDSFVVKPLFFPGGDIGKLAVHGTVNDLAVAGATPLYLSAAFILEEGFEIAKLTRIVKSMKEACNEAGVTLVTGDTKVIDRASGDEVFITTSGIGLLRENQRLSIHSAQPGDRILVSGSIGDHGITIMSAREGIEFETELQSDTASLADLTKTMLAACPSIRAMRDPTRGGLSSTLNELASASKVGIRIDESSLPVRKEVHAACEMLGLDPMYVANEGKLIAVVPENDAKMLLDVMQSHPLGRGAAQIGTVVDDHPRMVVMNSVIGGARVVAMISGEQLPRIC